MNNETAPFLDCPECGEPLLQATNRGRHDRDGNEIMHGLACRCRWCNWWWHEDDEPVTCACGGHDVPHDFTRAIFRAVGDKTDHLRAELTETIETVMRLRADLAAAVVAHDLSGVHALHPRLVAQEAAEEPEAIRYWHARYDAERERAEKAEADAVERTNERNRLAALLAKAEAERDDARKIVDACMMALRTACPNLSTRGGHETPHDLERALHRIAKEGADVADGLRADLATVTKSQHDTAAQLFRTQRELREALDGRQRDRDEAEAHITRLRGERLLLREIDALRAALDARGKKPAEKRAFRGGKG